MTFAAAGSAFGGSNNTTFSLTPTGVGNQILFVVICSTTTTITATSMSSSNANWSVLAGPYTSSANTMTATMFTGLVTSTSTATVTIGYTGGSPSIHSAGQEFSSTAGWALDTSGHLDNSSGTNTWVSLTPAGPGELYFGFANNSSVAVAGSTSGYTYNINADGQSDGMAYNLACTGSAQAPVWGDAHQVMGMMALIKPTTAPVFYSFPAVTVPPGLQSPAAWAPLMPPPWPPQPPPLLPAAAALSGSGSMAAAGGALSPGAAALDGEGYLTAAGGAGYGAMLSGAGNLTALSPPAANLYGAGTLTALPPPIANLSGQGQLGLNVTLKLVIGLYGTGSMSIPQVAGGLVNGVGGVGIPYALPGSSQVAVAPPGSTAWQWLGTLGQVTALTYSYVCPGGCDKMTATIMVPAAYRTQLFNPGWQVKITRGGHDVWHGKLDEPVPTSSGWTLTAVGQGNLGQDFLAIYTSTWPASQPDQSVNNAISRGMPWVNPGVGSPSGAWYGQAVDSGAQTVTALLNLICTRGGLTWYVNSQPGGQPGDDLSVFPLPAVPNRLLVATTPVARTLGGDINTIWIRYESAADNATSGAAATYAITSVQNAQSVAAHGAIETYIDLSDVGVQSAGAAQAVGNAALEYYTRASFAGPFTVSYGQLLNTGGAPIDPGTDQASTVVRLILTDYGYGGEVVPQFPITFIVGAYEWDDFAQTATVTPFQVLDASLTGMLSAWNTVNTPITAASG